MFFLKPIKDPRSLLIIFIYFIFYFVLLEGCLRKWLLPTQYIELYFLKDFLLIFIYVFAIKYKFLGVNKYEKLIFILVGLISVYGIIGFFINKNNILAYVLGLRSYWIFVPLTLIIINVFKEKNFITFLKINLYFVIIYFILILFQTYSSPSAIINSGYNSLVMNPERPSGFFTYTTQNTFYFIFLTVIFYTYILIEKILSKKKIFFILFLNLILSIILILLKSRAVYIYYFLIFFTAGLIVFFINQKSHLKLKKLIIILVTTPLFLILSAKAFDKQFKFSLNRINTDTHQEMSLVKKFHEKNFLFFNLTNFCEKQSSICRIIDMLFFFSENNTSAFGEGIGSGTSSVATMLKKNKLYLGENENQRIINELGFFLGFIIVMIKYFSIFLLFIFFFKKRAMTTFPFFLFVSVQLLIGNITYSTTFTSFIFWFSLGMFINNLKKS